MAPGWRTGRVFLVAWGKARCGRVAWTEEGAAEVEDGIAQM